MDKLLKKFIAVLLVITLAGANLSILGMYGISYALSDDELAGQTTQTGNSNVEFNAYFEGGGHIKTEQIESQTAKLYVNIKVKNEGYLKNGTIRFEDVNFKIGEITNDSIQSIDTQNNTIVLKQLNNGSDVTIEIPISILDADYVSMDHFSKETKTKFSGTYINGNGDEKSVSNEIINKLSWETTAEGIVTSEFTKYVPYATGGKYGVILQTKVNSGIVDSKLPIKKTQINVQVPEINGVKPTNVTVVANHTKATNGESDGLKFTKDNYSYNSETGMLQITVENASDQIVWLKKVQDEYLITYIFESQEIYNDARENGVDTTVTTTADIEVYQNENLTLNVSEVSTPIKAEERLGTIADFDIDVTEQISKGQIYSNYDVQTKKEVSYYERYTTTVNSVDLTDTIQFTQGIDKFLTADGDEALTTVSGNNYTYNKTVIVDVDVFGKMLGEDGSIDVYKEDQTKIGTINKDTEVKDGNYVLDISNQNTNEIYMITSRPITEGKLDVTIEKAIKTNMEYSKAQMKTFTKMEASLEGKASTSTVNASKQFLLKEPTSVAKIAISKTDLTTVVKNENVEIRATLASSDEYNALYKNPTLKITLPSYISNVDIKNYDILMANGLTIKGEPQVTTENGKPVISIELEGMQEEYTIGAEYEGTIIVLNTDLTVKTLTPSNSNKITMEFTNENDVSTNSKGTVEAAVNFVAPVGIVAANGISNYADKESDIMSISDQGVTGNIATYAEKRTATVYGKIINNYENAIKDVIILGRLPVENNKKIDSTETLNSTFSTTLSTNVAVTGIDSTKYTVYYSENVDATTDLSNTDNGWTTNATTATKSYMIVTDNYEMKAGAEIDFSYDVEIPANLKHNQSVSEMYKVYYNNVSSIGEIAETKTSPVMTLATGKGPELTVELKSTADIIREGQIIRMKVIVKNTGSDTAENVKVNVPLPEYAAFVGYEDISGNGFFDEDGDTKVIDVGTVEPGETKEVVYHIEIDDDLSELPPLEEGKEYTDEDVEKANTYPKETTHQVTVTADNLADYIPSNEYKLIVQDGKISLTMVGGRLESQPLKSGEILSYDISLYNISKQGPLNNTVVTIPLPEGVKYQSAEIKNSWGSEESTTEGVNYDEETNTVTINIGTLDMQKAILLRLEVQEFSGSIAISGTVKADEIEEQYSNVTEYKVEIMNLEVSELTSTPRYVKEGDTVTYTLTLTNKGESAITTIRVSDVIPEGLTFIKATYTYAGNEQSTTTIRNGRVDINIGRLEASESITIRLIAKAGILPDTNDKEVTNSMTITAKNYEGTTTNTVTNIIEYYQAIHDQIEGNLPSTPEEGRYRITGTAWLDSDKNGRRDAEETLLSDIPVILLNKADNSIVRDVDTNEEKRTTTGSDGTYEFTNLEPGDYIAIFLYDVSRYSLTTYQEKDVDTGYNSDVIDINITVDGVRTIAGTTDILTISDENVRDVDIGLYISEKFDLKLDKYISKITLTTPTIGTRTYTYDDSQLAKIEVLGSNLDKSSIVIEYKMVVTNEGAVAGYAKKIVDYLPEGVGFSTELNKDWYLSDNGNVYNASLENELIQPGESKEVTLIVTKRITEDSLGNLNNNAEIYETYNEQGLEDMDSTAGNRVQEEDDMSSADIILSIVTGKIIMYTTITLGVVAILGFGIFEIRKRVLLKKKN